MLTMADCHRPTTCYDCTEESCLFHGDKGADCPKYHCDNAVLNDCENCSFIDAFIDDMRQVYADTRRNNSMLRNTD